MGQTSADVLIDALQDWGVDTIFGLPGDGINGIMESLRTRQDSIRFVQVRHEESAAFMACAYAKYTGKLGVCLATTGPGGIHLLNGLYDAKLDGQPVLAITGLPFHDLIGTLAQQDVELDKLFADVSAYNERIMGPAHVEAVVDLACRTALTYRKVAHVTIPVDVQSMEATGPRSKRNVPHHTSDALARGGGMPSEQDLAYAARILNDGAKVAIVAGRGALGARLELEELAERLAAPIIKPLLGKAVVPDDSPYTTGGIGLLGTKPSVDVLQSCDTLCVIGTSFPYIEFFPKPGQCRAVQIELDPMRVGLRYPVDVGLVGDSRRILQVLLPMIEHKAERGFLENAQHEMGRWRADLEAQAMRDGAPMKPQRVTWELGKQLRDDAIISCDSGTVAVWFARFIPARANQMFSVSGNLASMACALPYAIAAQVAYPGRQCVALAGDGGLSMLMAEFATCVKYGLPVKVIVLKNDSLAMIKWEQMTFLGNPEYGCDLQPIDFALVAEACGGTGLRVDRPEDCADAIAQMLAVPGPAILEAIVDPLEPPMPPRVGLEDALNLAKALAKGEPDRGKIAVGALNQGVRQLV